MSNQVGDCFKFLWPFQNVRTLQYKRLLYSIKKLQCILLFQRKNKRIFYYLLFDTLVLQIATDIIMFKSLVFQGKLPSAGNDSP